jgi:hypothetical protein
MPGTTSSGFPYAEPTDPLVQWPATSQALAEHSQAVHLNTAGGKRFEAGRMYGGQTDARVTFPRAFTVAPDVVVSAADMPGTHHITYEIDNLGFTWRITANDGSASQVNATILWIACAI